MGFTRRCGPRRSLCVTVFIAAAVFVALATAGVAGARTIVGTADANTLKGTARGDVILGLAGADRLYGGRGNDSLAGGAGRDIVRCGTGRDRVLADSLDVVAASCESVRRLGQPAPTQSAGGSASSTQSAGGSTSAAAAAAPPQVAPPPAGHQHGPTEGHLLGTGEWGKIDFVGRVDVTNTPDLVADVAVSPDGEWAYLANWGEPDCAGPETGGQTSPDAGAWVIDISGIDDANPGTNPAVVGFIPSHQDTRPGEGMQVVEITTSMFSGDVLVMNNEQCGKNGKGGVSLWDVSDPTKPKKLSEHFGDRGFADTNEIHSAFAWDAGENAYLVMTDNLEGTDVDILDITNPHRPRLIADLNLNEFVEGGIDQPDHPLFLAESFLHDMVVKQIGDRWIMLLSYWDGGFVLLDVTDPANPVYIDDTDFATIDPELRESFPTTTIPPEGNAHQAEFTLDNRFIIGTDEDFAAYRPIFQITSGPNAGQPGDHPAGWFDWTVPIDELTGDGVVNGPVVYGGYGCPEDAASIPDPSVLGPLAPDEEAILVLQRGPVEDPDANFESCFFSQKVEAAQEAGYDVVLIANHHVGANEGLTANAAFCGSMGHEFEVTISAICISHRTFHQLFGTAERYDVPYAGGEPAIGAIGADVRITQTFDGWGYVHLFDAATLQELDTFAIPEAHDPRFATGFGDLSVHEVATDPQDASLAYLSYYSGGLRAIQIQCTNPADTSTCDLVEVGGYLDPKGNDFWGVETFVGDDGQTYILASDRDDGLWIFRDP